MGLIDFKYATLKLSDATPTTPLTYTVVFGEGNFSYSEQRPIEYIKDRGRVAQGQVRLADEEPVSIDIQGSWTEMRAAASGPRTLEEALKGLTPSGGTAMVSTGDACEPFALDLIFEHGGECVGGTIGHRLTFPDFRYEQLDYDAKAGTVKITGKAKCTSPTIIRTALS